MNVVTPHVSTGLIVIAEGEALPTGVAESLCGLGHNVVTTFDALQALHHAECQTRRILLLRLPADGTCSALDAAYAVRRKTSTVPLILIPAESSEAVAIAALRAGVTDFLSPPVLFEELLASVHRCLERGEALSAGQSFAPREPLPDPPRMIGESRGIRAVLGSIMRAASTDSTVLITGETGTGKELVAELIHYHSVRRARPLVRLNCAAIPDTLLESELFGYERGAFTGAHAAFDGKLQRADGGTVLLDEIGDMTPFAQAKLLRVIETKEADRLGGRKQVTLNIRIIAATNLDLDPLLAQGRFRKDLFFRLNVVRIHLPPLRERREDIPSLVQHYIGALNARMGTCVSGLTASALEAIVRYDWPGNVRELKNVLEATIVGYPYGAITPGRLPKYLREAAAAIRAVDYDGAADRAERERVLSVLFETNWNKCKAAKQLHWSRMTLYRKMAKYRIVSV
jgi:DNA-binding NtrC family response regulator